MLLSKEILIPRISLSIGSMVHFGINAPRIRKSLVYNKSVFCNEVYLTNAKSLGIHATQLIMDAIDSRVCHQESKSNFILISNK
jgi:hypothetical protein